MPEMMGYKPVFFIGRKLKEIVKFRLICSFYRYFEYNLKVVEQVFYSKTLRQSVFLEQDLIASLIE